MWLVCPTERGASNLRHNAWNLIVDGRLGKTREREGEEERSGRTREAKAATSAEVCYSEKKTFLD